MGIISERNREKQQLITKYLNPNRKITNSAILIEEDEEAENGGNSNKSSSINKAMSSDQSMSSSTDQFTDDEEGILKNERPSTKIVNYKC